ncbi:hypothetical protein ONE63_003477 [Megalurothrips usitatus]|uniref:Uncharacterized protein n=1 Tax=Megalurothrips usitatus TaxID=439358 RepID=A0AAV7XBV2_9NEOP|nr:hypothetical protein ONE63_003477 [Megalurothrips usitatus]
MQDSTMPLPKMISRHFRIRTYEISEHQYLHPAELIDLMVEKTNVCETGVFMARLNVETLEENTVQAVKELARKDGDCKHFKPLLIKARARWPETGFYLVTSHDEGETPEEDGMLKVLQKDFIDSFVNHNFSTSPPTAL